MDNLDICLREAKKHGLSYGEYMAAVGDGKYTPPIPPKKDPGPDPRAIKCRYCQQLFVPNRYQRYCSDDCRDKMAEQRYRQKADRWPVVSTNKKT